MIRVFMISFLCAFSAHAADARYKFGALEECLFSVRNASQVHRNNDLFEHDALYKKFSAWYQKQPAHQKALYIDGSQTRRAFQQFLNTQQSL